MGSPYETYAPPTYVLTRLVVIVVIKRTDICSHCSTDSAALLTHVCLAAH